jgi:predicted transcriptional regulator
MSPRDPLQGDLQQHAMRVIWQRGQCTVEDVRQALPARERSAYTTVQTVLNRLVDRGLLAREKVGKAFCYSAKVSEGDYLAASLNRTLVGASAEARRAALAQLVDGLDATDVREIRSLADEITRRRRRRK